MTKDNTAQNNISDVKKMKMELIRLNTQLKLGSLKQFHQIKKIKREIARKLTQENSQLIN